MYACPSMMMTFEEKASTSIADEEAGGASFIFNFFGFRFGCFIVGTQSFAAAEDDLEETDLSSLTTDFGFIFAFFVVVSFGMPFILILGVGKSFHGFKLVLGIDS